MNRTEIIATTKRFLSEEFEVEENEIVEGNNLQKTLDLDSLDYVDLVVVIEENLGFKPTAEDFKSIDKTVNLSSISSFCKTDFISERKLLVFQIHIGQSQRAGDNGERDVFEGLCYLNRVGADLGGECCVHGVFIFFRQLSAWRCGLSGFVGFLLRWL